MFETTKNTEYLEDLFKFLKVVEGFGALPYNDHAKGDKGYLTIGYGANLKERSWIIATLNELGLFGSVKDLKTKEDIEALDNKANKAKIDEFYNITKQIVTNDNISTIRTQLNDLLKKYTGQSGFKLNKEQAIKIKKIASNSIFDYTSRINDKTLKMDKETNEYAGILSYAFNVGNDSRKYFFDICNKDKDNRFLAFFTLRYGVNFSLDGNSKFGIAKRRFWESLFFGFEYKENRAFKMAIGIFKILNFKYTQGNYNKYYVIDFQKEKPNQTYLDWIIKYEDELLYAKKNQNQTYQEFYNADARANNLPEKFRNIQGITPNKDNFLHPYLTYINQTFAKGAVSEYTLNNIYVLKEIKDCENLNVALSNRNDTRDFTPLLIICLKPNTQSHQNIDTYSIEQTKNTFISIVVFEGAKLDMSKIDTEKSEILYARLKDESNIDVVLLQGSHQSMILDSTTNTLIIKGNSNETYIFDKAKNTTQESQISPILKVYMDKEANPNGYIEIHNFAKESINDSNTYILGNDCKQRYCGITLFLDEGVTPHNTDCSNEGNFQIIVQNLDKYGLDKGDTLYLYSCENRKGVSVNVDDNYSATFSITLDLPEQDEISKRCLSSHIILTTNPIKNTETIEEQMIHSNPHFQVNKSAKLAKQYIITDARLNTKKQPIVVKEVAQQLRVKAIGYREKYLHYSVNSIVKLEAQYNLKNPPQDKIGQTKWAYILTDNKTAPTQKQLNEKQYKHFIQHNGNEQYTGNNIDFRIQKEWLDIDKPKYLYIYAYLNAPSTKTSLCITIQYPLSLRFNGKELQILEWGEVKRDSVDSHIFDKRNENTAYYRIYSKEHDIIEKQDIPKLLSSYSLLSDIIDIEKYYKSNHYKEQDVIESIKQDTSLPKGSYYLYIKDIEESLKIRTDYLYTRAKGYKALNIYTIDTNNQYKISYHNNPLDNIPYPKGTTFLTAPNTPIPTHYTDERVKIFLKGSRTYKDFISNLKQKIDTLKTQGYEIDKVKLEVGYEEELPWISIAKGELGIKENTSKSEHNPRVIEYHSTTTGKFQDDETPWCSSFVNWVITQAGLKGTNSARAASWKDWGQKLDKPAYGCIGVIVRANGTGHVTFIVGKLDNKKLVGLGGNQANSVKYSEYSTNNFKAFVYPIGYNPDYELPSMDDKFVGKGDSTR